MNTLKRILAVIGLLFAAAFVITVLVLIVQGTMKEHMDLVLILLSAFLGTGLLSLAIRWLQDLKAKAEAEKAANGSGDA